MFWQYMATLKHGDTEREEKELTNKLEEVVINISHETRETGQDGDDRLFSHLAYIDDKKFLASFLATLNNNSVRHSMTQDAPIHEKIWFDGVMIDIGASRGTTAA